MTYRNRVLLSKIQVDPLYSLYIAAMKLLSLLALLAGCRTSNSTDWAQYGASIFADLTVSEMKAVRAYLHGISEMKLVDVSINNLKKNNILLIELYLPKKNEALKALDLGQARPLRQARVIIQFGNQTKPNITEYIVTPLPTPTSHEVKTFKGGGRVINYESRPMNSLEGFHLNEFLRKITAPAQKLLLETTGGPSFNSSFNNCPDYCSAYADVVPCGQNPGERRSWIMLQKPVEGYFLHPIGLELLINHKDLDPNKWTLEKVWYNNMYFDSVEELVEKYESGAVEKIILPHHNLYSTFIPRGLTNTPTDIYGPKLVQPQGPRYYTDRNFVRYAGWSFSYGVRSSAGLQIFDLCFNGERVAYEISLQEAISFYSDDSPAGMQTKNIDSGWAMGTSTFELGQGIDCPEIATFVDLYHFYDTDKPNRYRNALCIFEMTTSIPLRRHFDSDRQGGYNFYGGLDNTVLVLRTTTTVDNYDYIWDFIFYQNGVVEVKMSATGYIHATFLTPNGLHYGTRVQKYVLGNLHTHLIHFKVDLDIAGGY